MAYDGITTKIIADELQSLSGSRIDKVFQPNKNEILIGLYNNGQNFLLNICIDSQNYRLNLTTHPKANPQVAPNFCMLLRKHLVGLKLKNIITSNLERIITLEIEGFDEFDDIVSKKLIIELMGKHGNIILVDESNIIIDSLRHIKNDDDDTNRSLLPHIKYTSPKTNKYNFLDIHSFDEFMNKLGILSNNISLDISNTFNGISKIFIDNIIKKLNIDTVTNDNLERIYKYLNNIINISNYEDLCFETIEYNKNNKIKNDYFICPSNKENSPYSLNFYIDDFYYNKETLESFKTYRDTTLKLILNVLKKYNTRLSHIQSKLNECENMEIYKLYGELITANLYRIPNNNLENIKLENYYENNNLILIPLDKKYLPSENAKRYFKKYNKLKNTLEIVSKQKEETLKELDYIESIVYELETSNSLEDVSQIFNEISENVLFKENIKNTNKKNIKIKKSKLTKNKEASFNPLKYTFDEYTVFVGRTNTENDYLTTKFASKNDYWFHTKDIHGSHVILKNIGIEPSDEILYKCAELAAKHSKARNSSNVPVDYCLVKYVKKPNGSKPGMVIYTTNKTIYVK